jgi:hypothetical protein
MPLQRRKVAAKTPADHDNFMRPVRGTTEIAPAARTR